MAATRRALRLVATTLAVLAGTASSSAAETLMMPTRDALKNTAVVVWGITTRPNQALPANNTTWILDFGDGTQTSSTALVDRSYIAVQHPYAGDPTGAPKTYTATLIVTHNGVTETAQADIQVFDPAPLTADELRSLRINMAIQDALRWLWVNQVNSGGTSNRVANFGNAAGNPATVATWGGASFTALVVLAFENHGYRLSNNNNVPNGLYQKYVVRRGLNSLNGGLTSFTATQQAAGNPCVGLGDPPPATCTAYSQNESQGYSTAIAMMPLAASGALDRQSTETTNFTQNKTYREILQRLSNGLAWGQTDANEAVNRGGWRYGFQTGFDGSTVGWDILALLDAAASNIAVPAFVKTEFAFGFNNALNTDGSFDYTADANAGVRQSPNVARTGTGLQGLFYLGTTYPFAAGSKGEAAVKFISDRWNGQVFAGDYTGSCGPAGVNKGCAYAIFNVFKALKLHGITTLPGVSRGAGPGLQPAGDWYADYQDWLVNNQTAANTTAGGNWATMAFSSSATSQPASTAIGLLVLAPVALILPDEDKFKTIGLGPVTGLSNPGAGQSHTVTATTLNEAGGPVPGVTVTFRILAGPNINRAGQGVTNASGQTSFTYFDTGGSGTDVIQAFVGALSSNVVTMVWNTPPVLTVVGPAAPIEATSAAGAAVPFIATATDVEDGPIAPVCKTAQNVVVVSGSTFALGTTQVTCTATDAGGLTDTESFSITVRDTTPPTIDPHANLTIEATSAAGAVGNYTRPATHDAVDGNGLATCVPVSGGTFSLGHHDITCSATDAAGNVAMDTHFDIFVVDTTPPAIDPHDDLTVEATDAAGAVVDYTSPATHDVVDGDGVASCTPVSGGMFSLGSHTVTCSATDAAGNMAESMFDISVVDTTPPVIDSHADVTVEATSAAGAVVDYASPVTHDAVDGDGVASCAPMSGGTFALGTHTVTCSATDAAGNMAVPVEFNVHVVDTTAPTIDPHASLTVEATSAAGAVVDYMAPATHDAVDGDGVAMCEPATGGTFALGTHRVTCSATDAAGNAAMDVYFDILVVDTTAPVFDPSNAPDDIVVEATGPDGAAVMFHAPVAEDAVNGDITAVCSPPSGSVFTVGTTTVECVAADAAGNMVEAMFDVTVTDTTAPLFDPETLPDDITVEATGPDGASVMFDAPAAADAVSGDLTAVCNPPSGHVFAVGTTTVECVATDAAGNMVAATFDVTVTDTTAPVLDPDSVPDDITVEATGPDGAAVMFDAPTAEDTVSGDLTLMCNPPSGSVFAVGTTMVACVATDAAGNMVEATFDVTVSDTTAPVLDPDSVPDDITIEATGPDGAAVMFDAPMAEDTVSGDLTLVCNPPSGSVFAVGTTMVACVATDGAGNMVEAMFDVTVTDTTAPVLDPDSVPNDITVEATGPDGAVVTFDAPIAQDLVDGDQTAVCNPPSGTTFASGTTTVTCAFTDAAGNMVEAMFDVIVTDTTAPVFDPSTLPADITAEATSPDGAVVTFPAPETSDAVGGDGVATCSPASGSTFAVGSTQVTCTASDAAGNMSTHSFNVTVVDTTPPALSLPADIVQAAVGPDGNVILFSASAWDLVDGNVTVVCVPPSGSLFGVGTTIVNCVTADAAGNVRSDAFHVSVLNNAPNCSAVTTTSRVWPPNHKMVPIVLTGATDSDGDALALVVTAIFQDEPTNTVGDGNTSSDAAGIGTSTPSVRAERSGTPKVPGNGRVYHIYFKVTDTTGAACNGEVKVGVPHDQGNQRTLIDDGPKFNSVTGAPGTP